MLPVTVRFLVAMLAYDLNERTARKAEYLREENRGLKEALRAATGKTRIPLTDEQRSCPSRHSKPPCTHLRHRRNHTASGLSRGSAVGGPVGLGASG